jgi:TonB family protein
MMGTRACLPVVTAAVLGVVLSVPCGAQKAKPGVMNAEDDPGKPIACKGTAGVTPPRLTKLVGPKSSDEARKKKVSGTVRLWFTVGADGHTRDVDVTQMVGYGLDLRAISAVNQWMYTPATKGGVAIACQTDAEITFDYTRKR